MQAITYTLTPLSAFATPLLGDTLFGQLCWAIRNRYGEQRLEELLQGYTDNQPFAIISDAFPKGYLPKPTLPARFLSDKKVDDTGDNAGDNTDDIAQRKVLKKKIWMPLDETAKPLNQWQTLCKTNQEVISKISPKTSQTINTNTFENKRMQPHNSINRFTGTTGEGQFAPYGMLQTWYHPDLQLQCHILLDEKRFTQAECQQCLHDIGNFGFGRDASIGMGKFSIDKPQSNTLASHPQANALMTLAPSAPQGMGYNEKHSYYQPFTRFGRHGDIAVHQKGKPFKNPILMAATGAVISRDNITNPQNDNQNYIGQGLGGSKQNLSKSIEATVQQGYAPVIGVYLDH